MSNFALNKYSKLRLIKNIKSETLQIVSSLFIQLIFPLAMINIFGVYNFGNFILFITILSLLDVFKMNINSFGIQKMSYFYNLKKKKIFIFFFIIFF